MVSAISLSSYYEKFLATGEVKCIDDEIPFEIPKGWEWTRIRNISQSYIGLTYSPTDVSSRGTIVLRSSNIQDGKIVLNDVVRVSKEISKKLQVEKNDIIICARNGSAKLVGKSAVVTDVTEPMTFGAFMAICKTALYQYVSIFLQSDLFFSQLRGVSGTTTINQLTQNNFNDFWIPIPPANEQKRIVEKLQNVSPFIERYSKSQETLNLMNIQIKEQLKKSILQEAIQGKLVPQIAEEGTAQELLEQIRQEKQKLVKEGKLKKSVLTDSVIYKGDDNKYYEQVGNENIDITEEIPFDLPENWTWVRFGQYVRMSIGKTPPRGETKYWANGKYPWVSISDMSDYGLVTTTKESVSEYAKSLFGEISPVGTLIMSFKLTVGRTSLLNTSAYHNEAIISIYPFVDKNYQARNFLFHILPIISNLGDTKDAIKGKTLNSKSLNNLLLPLPPLNEQGRIVAMIELLFDKLK
ncbi:restriction endonuclease subunit S [Phocaeicola vulgatus]|uniref:restriction endonuclease subunit S n=1 Tax=Phocaeicola vulgatus TaxID=821 RepID=UPI003DA2187B